MSKQVILYGFAGADQNYKVVTYFCIYEKDISIKFIRDMALRLKSDYPNIIEIYAIDNNPKLKNDYIHACIKPTIENCIVFKDILERDGCKII